MSECRSVLGIGVVLPNSLGEVLCVRRCGEQSPGWTIPDGVILPGQTAEEAASVNMLEKLGIQIINPKFIGLVDNRDSYKKDGIYIYSTVLIARSYIGNPEIQPSQLGEFDEIGIFDAENYIPEPHYPPSRRAIEHWLGGIVYEGVSDGKDYNVLGADTGLM